MTERVRLALHNAQAGHAAFLRAWVWCKAMLMAGHRLTLEIRKATRSGEQNAKFHALCSDVARSGMKWAGKERTAAEWKVLFVSGHSVATKSGADMVPGLESEFVNLRESTANMSVSRSSSLIEYVVSWCAMNDVRLPAYEREAESA